MDEERLWALFFATGLPQVYLAIRAGEKGKRTHSPADPGLTAFRAGPGPARNI